MQDFAEQADLNADQSSEIKIACGEVERCRSILHSLVTAAQSAQESGHRVLSIGEILDRTHRQAKNLFPATDIQLDLSSDLASVQVRSDNALEQSLLNLYANAIEASQSNGQSIIEVRVNMAEQFLQIVIRDFGKGITPEMQSKLGRMLVSEKPNGLGIGYFLANASINRIGGRLSIQNLDIGGAETCVELPLLDQIPEPQG